MSEPSNIQATDLNNLSQMYVLNNILSQMYKNIILIEEGATGLILYVNGGSLFQIAAQQYGDATLWTNIALANGLTDPQLPVGVSLTLIIPPQTTNTGGLLIQ